MRIRCKQCKFWDRHKQKWSYGMAEITDWRPKKGTENRLRQFKCGRCLKLTYQPLTENQLYLERLGRL